VCGLTYNCNLKRIVTFQKKAIRIVAKVPFDSHTDPILRDLKFSDVVLFYLGKFMFFFSIHLMTCLHWLIIFILIILETHPIAIFIFHYFELIYKNFQSASKALNFKIVLTVKLNLDLPLSFPLYR